MRSLAARATAPHARRRPYTNRQHCQREWLLCHSESFFLRNKRCASTSHSQAHPRTGCATSQGRSLQWRQSSGPGRRARSKHQGRLSASADRTAPIHPASQRTLHAEGTALGGRASWNKRVFLMREKGVELSSEKTPFPGNLVTAHPWGSARAQRADIPVCVRASP